MEKYVFYILLPFNILIYICSFILIMKRKNYSSISIRSPTLLVANNIGGFIMSTIIIIYYNFATKQSPVFYYIPFGFYLAEFLMIVSFIMRYRRIDMCCKIYESEQIDKNEFNKRRYLYGEKYYVKILLITFTLFLIIMILIWVITRNYENTIPEFLYKREDSDNKLRMIFYICFHFIMMLVLIHFCIIMIHRENQQKTLLEIVGFTLCWFILFNGMTALDKFLKKTDNKYETLVLTISLVSLYFCLFINGYMPIIMSFFSKSVIGYHFNPQLMNNLYLFLSNEECYGCFNEYLKDDEISSFYLLVYTHIMTFKLQFLNEDSMVNLYQEAKDIHMKYFIEPNLNKFSENVVEAMKDLNVESITEEGTNAEMFDSALKFVFEELSKKFVEFKSTEIFEALEKNIAIQSYIQCKMSNTGLINKY